MLLVLAAYVAGMFTDIMEIDAAQYASMSRNILEQDNILFLFDRGKDYLDKPPLIFWLTALSFKLFGINNFSYRLPSILFSLLAIGSVYGLGKLYYKEKTAFLAALVTASCQAFFVMNQDVKTDMYLLGSVMFALWQFAAFIETEKWHSLLLGFVGVGLGLLSKGPLGVVLPAMGVAGHLCLTRNWRMLFNWKWLVGVPLVALILLPMCIGLYQQHGKEGLEFFFWTQSFGRVTGDSSWKNDTTPFFLVHSFLWAFLPWTLLFLWALGRKCVEIVKNWGSLPAGSEAYTFTAFILGGLSLSTSNFILPHYAFVLVPLAAIMFAEQVEKWQDQAPVNKALKVFTWVHAVLGGIFLLALAALLFWAFPNYLWVSIPLYLAVVGMFVFYVWKGSANENEVWLPAFVAIVGANLLINALLYPQILNYQAGSQAARYIRKEGFPVEKVYGYGDVGRSMDVYLHKDMELMEGNRPVQEYISTSDLYLYAMPHALEQMDDANIQYELLKEFEIIHVGRLSLMFINPQTRSQVVGKRYFVHVPQQ